MEKSIHCLDLKVEGNKGGSVRTICRDMKNDNCRDIDFVSFEKKLGRVPLKIKHHFMRTIIYD